MIPLDILTAAIDALWADRYPDEPYPDSEFDADRLTIEGHAHAVLEAVLPLLRQRYKPVIDILTDLTDPNPCWYDHHGYCQEHGWMTTDPPCAQKRAKEWLNGGTDETPTR